MEQGDKFSKFYCKPLVSKTGDCFASLAMRNTDATLSCSHCEGR